MCTRPRTAGPPGPGSRLPVTNASVTFVDSDHGFLMGVYAQALAPPDDFQESFALWETSDAGAGWSAVTRVPSVKGPGPIAPIALPDGCPPVATGSSTLPHRMDRRRLPHR